MFRRRVFASIAAFAVAFAALWPLVSAARPRSPDIPAFICTQSGGVQHPGGPVDRAEDFHCPLCIASADVVVPVIVAAPALPQLHAIANIDSRIAGPQHLFSPRPPPSRAPPHNS